MVMPSHCGSSGAGEVSTETVANKEVGYEPPGKGSRRVTKGGTDPWCAKLVKTSSKPSGSFVLSGMGSVTGGFLLRLAVNPSLGARSQPPCWLRSQ